MDTYPGDVRFSDPTAVVSHLRVPEDAAAGQTIQIVLEAIDGGSPPLTRYQRVVVTVRR